MTSMIVQLMTSMIVQWTHFFVHFYSSPQCKLFCMYKFCRIECEIYVDIDECEIFSSTFGPLLYANFFECKYLSISLSTFIDIYATSQWVSVITIVNMTIVIL